MGLELEHQEALAVGRQDRGALAPQGRQPLQLAARDGQAVGLVDARVLAVGGEHEGLAVGRQRRRRDLERALGQAAPGRLVDLPQVEMGEAVLLGEQPDGLAVAQPAEVEEFVFVDPGGIGPALQGEQAAGVEVHQGEPAVLVVLGEELDGQLVAPVVPLEAVDLDPPRLRLVALALLLAGCFALPTLALGRLGLGVFGLGDRGGLALPCLVFGCSRAFLLLRCLPGDLLVEAGVLLGQGLLAPGALGLVPFGLRAGPSARGGFPLGRRALRRRLFPGLGALRLGLFPQLAEGIVGDAGQGGEVEVVAPVAHEVEQDQLRALRIDRADLGPHLLHLDVARLGDELGHVVGRPVLAPFLGQQHQEPAAVRRERGVEHLHLVAEVPGERRAGRIGALLGLCRLARPVLPLLALAQGREQAPLLLGEHLLVLLAGRELGQGRRVLREAQLGRLALEARSQVAHEVGAAHPAAAVGDLLVAPLEARLALHLAGTGELADGARGHVLEVDVALAGVDLLPPVLRPRAARRVRLAEIFWLDLLRRADRV